jgi:hypothetical protein
MGYPTGVTGQPRKDEELGDTAAERVEFAEAPPAGPEAQAAFREGLREKLWKMVRRQLGREVDDSNGLG